MPTETNAEAAAEIRPQGSPANERTCSWVPAGAAALVSGGLMAACYWPANLHWLAWVALVPWLALLPRLSPGAIWPVGTLLGLVFYRIGLNWGFSVSGPLAGTLIVVFSIWLGFGFRVARILMDRFGLASMAWRSSPRSRC